MKQRSIKIINKKFQLGFTARNTAISLIALTITIVLTWLIVSVINERASNAINRLNDVVSIENNITSAFIDYSKNIHSGNLRLVEKNIHTDHDKNMKSIQDHIEQIDRMRNTNYNILILFITLIILQVIILVVYNIRTTHKIAGPMYVMDRMIQDILDGEKPELRNLRKGDEFIELYNKLIVLYNTKIQKKQTQKKPSSIRTDSPTKGKALPKAKGSGTKKNKSKR